MCWYKLRKAKSYFNNFWVVVVKNGPGFLGLGTLKSTVSQEWIDEISCFFAWWYKFRKAKSNLNYWEWHMVKNGQGRLIIPRGGKKWFFMFFENLLKYRFLESIFRFFGFSKKVIAISLSFLILCRFKYCFFRGN